jgi:phosphatidylinositol/phosphatidylcholine transfer protein
VNGFFKLITPFIDPLTRQKLKFNDDMRQHVPPQQLWNEFHGDMEFEYDHNVYWPALLKFADERYSQRRERWVKAGKHYGESETYLRGGDAPSLFQSSENDVVPTPEKETIPAESNGTAGEVKETALEEKKDGTVPVGNGSAVRDSKVPVQPNGTQSNGNMDVMTVNPEPVLTTE